VKEEEEDGVPQSCEEEQGDSIPIILHGEGAIREDGEGTAAATVVVVVVVVVVLVILVVVVVVVIFVVVMPLPSLYDGVGGGTPYLSFSQW